MFNPLAYLNDPVSRFSAGASSTGGGLLAVVASDPIQTLCGLLVAILGPVLIAAVNRWLDGRRQDKALRAGLAIAEETVRQLQAELARRAAAAIPTDAPPPSP